MRVGARRQEVLAARLDVPIGQCVGSGEGCERVELRGRWVVLPQLPGGGPRVGDGEELGGADGEVVKAVAVGRVDALVQRKALVTPLARCVATVHGAASDVAAARDPVVGKREEVSPVAGNPVLGAVAALRWNVLVRFELARGGV